MQFKWTNQYKNFLYIILEGWLYFSPRDEQNPMTILAREEQDIIVYAI